MLYFFMALCFASEDKQRPIKKKETCIGTPTQDEMFELAKQYYENQGIWSGIFYLSYAQQERIEQINDTTIQYHLQYKYTPVPNNQQGRTDSGSDQRIFFIECSKNWYVTDMGGYMSASFP